MVLSKDRIVNFTYITPQLRHGILVTPQDPYKPPYELFFSSRITLYLDLLDPTSHTLDPVLATT